jgi:hypothetical protein
MLNREFLAKEFASIADSIFSLSTPQISLTLEEWKTMTNSSAFKAGVQAAQKTTPLALCLEDFSEFYNIAPMQTNYTILGVDGSQVYPDRHLSSTNCFLINTGYCLLEYRSQSKATLFSTPKVFQPQASRNSEIPFSADIVDLKREDMEFELAFKKSLEIRNQKNPQNFACLYDGSLVFWHLETKPSVVKDLFLAKYLQQLKNFGEEKILIASLVSLPQNHEITNLFKAGLQKQPIYEKLYNELDLFIDAGLLQTALPNFHRTALLSCPSKIVDLYPDQIKPYFCYINAGKEIVRIEVPSWIAHDSEKFNKVCQIVLDQCLKGYGYPVALAEAHEQAVIKGPDRDFFYHLIHRIGVQNKHKLLLSQKSMKKRGMGF